MDRAGDVMKLVREMMTTPNEQNYEEDCVEVGGALHTRRLAPTSHVKSEMDAKLGRYRTKFASLRQQAPFAFSISPPGLGNTPHHIAFDSGFAAPTTGDEIDIMTRAETPGYGTFSAGFVLRTGPTSLYRPGDRILFGRAGLLRSHQRLNSSEVIAIPPNMSYVDACVTIPPMAAAYEAIVDIARARTSDKFLVHDGASVIG
ncbi:hypothetical protein F4779DRAFT_624265 [Xylariaceae sp. FL0662B]|nr:hypothetical protein F4779DRAFT_624265 [Xylariaceae sp. FL0662B]